MMHAQRTQTIIVFVKAPRPGIVKTRLIPFLSPEDAARLYHAFIRDTLTTVARLREVLISIAYTPSDAQPFLQTLLDGQAFDWFPQTGDPLGARLWHAFQRAFERGAHRVVTIGSDSPTLPTAIIAQAFEALVHDDVVLGPATDGGYYLIGLAKREPLVESYRRLFDAIAWSTDMVLSQTIHAIQAAGLTYTALPTWSDIDQPEDLARLSDAIHRLREAGDLEQALHTERVLQSLWGRERNPNE